MAHEINEFDNVVLHREAAWHGLGTVVQDAPSPLKALEIAGLGWQVEQWPLSATNGEGVRLAIKDQVMNVRADVNHPLGVVTSNYVPLQNSELAEFCALLAEQTDSVKIESAGSIRNGAKVWFLMKGESFSVRGHDGDVLKQYILASNGHDGKTGIRFTPTNVRVVCSNTLHAVIPTFDNGRVSKLAPASFCCNHLGDLKQKLEIAKTALQLYGRSQEATRKLIDQLAARDVSREDIQRFFLECYTRDFGAFADQPKDRAEHNARTRAKEAFAGFEKRFESESAVAGTTAWNAFNAYTGWSQNDRTFWKDKAKEAERRVQSKLFGQDSERTTSALLTALSL